MDWAFLDPDVLMFDGSWSVVEEVSVGLERWKFSSRTFYG
jgi:hypothetical protein